MAFDRLTCMVCGIELHYPQIKLCGSKECERKYPELCRARWEGRLLRNNVQLERKEK
jgi:hypothetical protein